VRAHGQVGNETPMRIVGGVIVDDHGFDALTGHQAEDPLVFALVDRIMKGGANQRHGFALGRLAHDPAVPPIPSRLREKERHSGDAGNGLAQELQMFAESSAVARGERVSKTMFMSRT